MVVINPLKIPGLYTKAHNKRLSEYFGLKTAIRTVSFPFTAGRKDLTNILACDAELNRLELRKLRLVRCKMFK